MKNFKLTISSFAFKMYFALSLTLFLLISYFKGARSYNTFNSFILFLFIISLYSIISMLVMKIINTRWINFIFPFIIYYLWGSIYLAVSSLVNFYYFPILNIILLVLLFSLSAISFFYLYERKIFIKINKEKNIYNFTYFQLIIFVSVSTVLYLGLTSFIKRDIPQALINYILFIFYSLAVSVVSVLFKRIVSNIWGNFKHSILIFYPLYFIFLIFFTIFSSTRHNLFHICLFALAGYIGIKTYHKELDVTLFFVKKPSEDAQTIATLFGKIKINTVKFRGLIFSYVKKLFKNSRLLSGRLKDYIKNQKQSIKIAIAASSLVIVFILYKLFIIFLTVHVTSVTPDGVVPLKANISMKFSEKFSIMKEDVETSDTADIKEKTAGSVEDMTFIKPGIKYFKITPHVNGRYVIKNNQTILFVPYEILKPSTTYNVELIKDRLKSGKILLGQSFTFNTPRFRVTGANLFYNYNIINNLEKEVVGEINFNAPVEIKDLIQYTSMNINGNKIKVFIEPSNIPTRFYLKSEEIKRDEKNVKIALMISDNLNCINGSLPLEKDFKQEILLPEKNRLQVDSVNTFPVVGNTFISIKFNIPVSSKKMKRYVYIIEKETKKNVPYSIETEYCYAVLKGNFKPNVNYEVEIKEGLFAVSGEKLTRDYTEEISIKDLNPEVKFESKGKILPLKGNMDIKVTTLNLDSFNIRIDKIFRNNIVNFLMGNQGSGLSRNIIQKNIEVSSGELNQYVPHYINLKKFHNTEYKGLFKIQLNQEQIYEDDYYENSSGYPDQSNRSQYILCTDIGLIAKEIAGDLLVNCYSIMDLSAIGNVNLKVISSDNQLLASGTTASDGSFIFKNWRNKSDNFTPFVLVAEKNDDFSFLKFYTDEINISRFNIGGEYASKEGLKAFVTAERGVYRPGDKAYITAFVRNSDLKPVSPLYVNLKITDPTNDKFLNLRKITTQNGTVLFEIAIPSYAKTGEYYISLGLSNNIILGSTSIKVEDFIPDKIKASIEAEKTDIEPGKPVVFKVKGVQLFGPPASDRTVVTQVSFTPRNFSHPSYQGYSFADNEKSYTGEVVELGEDKLDENGEKTYSVDIPSSISPPSALTANVYTEIFDDGGRPVSAVKNINVNYYPYYIGLKVKKRDVYFEKQPVNISYVAIKPDGKLKEVKDVKILVKHKVYYSTLRKHQWFKEKFQSDSYEEVIDHKKIDIKKIGHYKFVPKAAGEYIVYIYQDNGMKTSKTIYVQGYGEVAANLESSENLIINFNKDKYEIGETAVVNIHSSIDGKALINIIGDKILYSSTVILNNKRATIEIPVKEEYRPNVYFSAMVIRTPDEVNKNLPMSSLGIKNLMINSDNKNLKINIESATEVRSKNGLEVSATTSPNSDIILTAVDEGILQITQFKTPEPFDFFYRKKALVMKLFSIFDAVLPNVKALSLAIGGDEGEYDTSRRHLNPVSAKRVKPVSLHSGILKSDQYGNVYHKFDLPEFNGKIRVTAMAANNDNFGSSSRYVTVADPIVITASLPRVLAPGDEIKIPVRVFNKTGKKGKISVKLNIEGPVKIVGKNIHSLNMPDNSERKTAFYVKAVKDAGKAAFKFTASGNSEQGQSTIELPVRPGRSLETIVKYGEIQPNKSVTIDVPGNFINFGQRIRLSVSPNYLNQFVGSLEYLINYPYGCAEQTTSRVFPLLYLKKLVDQTGVLSHRKESIDYYINEGIKKLEAMQRSDGFFNYWPGENNYNSYVSNYVSHFLLEANRMGYQVDKDVLEKIHEAIGIKKAVSGGRLDRRNNYSWDDTDIYTLYLKALAGKPDYETMEYLRKNNLKKLDYLELCRLASAYGLIDEKDKGKEILPSEFKVKFFPRSLGGDFSSYTRRMAIYLITLNEVDPGNSDKFEIAKELAKLEEDGHFGTTQDNVFALIALAKTFESPDEDIDMTLLLNNKIYKKIDNQNSVVTDKNIAGKKITLQNNESSKMFYNLFIEGTPGNQNATPVNNGLKVSKEYFDENGEELNLSNVELGQKVVATITVKPKKEMDNLVVVDILPAGFEIENIRLKTHGELNFEPLYNWVSAYEDIRDDRLILFTGSVNEEINYSYTLRAVAPGKFFIPQVYAEAMYDPKIFSIEKAKGSLTIVDIDN